MTVATLYIQNTKRLKTGNTKSCGCYQRDIASQILKAAMHKENTYDLEKLMELRSLHKICSSLLKNSNKDTDNFK